MQLTYLHDMIVFEFATVEPVQPFDVVVRQVEN